MQPPTCYGPQGVLEVTASLRSSGIYVRAGIPCPYRPQGLTAALGSSRVHARAGQAGQARWWGLCPLSDGENLTNHSLHLETQKWPLQHISF